jgi:hypothetical protein
MASIGVDWPNIESQRAATFSNNIPFPPKAKNAIRLTRLQPRKGESERKISLAVADDLCRGTTTMLSGEINVCT